MDLTQKCDTDKSLDIAMDVMILKFPLIAENIFGELDDKTMTNCKEVSRPWNVFLDEKKVQWFRILQKYASNMVYFFNDWKIVLMKTPTKTFKTLALQTHQFFEANPELIKKNTQSSPLSIAAAWGILEIYEYVSEKYKSIGCNASDCTVRSMQESEPLCHAASNGCLEVCKFIIANSEYEKELSAIRPPLHSAACEGYLDICQFLIENGMDKDLKDKWRTTPLIAAAYYGHPDVCKYLISKSAKADHRNDHTYMPIHYAAQEGHFEVCKIILDKMDDKNPRDFVYGLTPFMQAAQNGHLDVCRFFMYGIEEKINNPIVKFLYLVMLLFLYPHLALFLGFQDNTAKIWFQWPYYFAIICFAWFAPFIYLYNSVYYSLLSVFSVYYSDFLAIILSFLSFMIFTYLLHLYFKRVTRNLPI